MHREVIDAEPGDIVDHINGNTLDNRRSNLRIVSVQQNNMNRRKVVGKSGIKGVFHRRNKWQARITLNKKDISLGSFATKEEAQAAYIAAAKNLFGEFASC